VQRFEQLEAMCARMLELVAPDKAIPVAGGLEQPVAAVLAMGPLTR
jgi:hypothetical protein